jgi:cytoskeletal protein CcmA (bactofilin family)
MSLFRRDDSPEPPLRPERSTAEGSAVGTGGHLAAGSRVDGAITGSADWWVDGELVGSLQLEGRVTIGTSGKVLGTVTARTIRIAGRVEGDVVAAEKVEVVASGHLEGNITTKRVIIAEGAFFKGSVAMAAPEPKSSAKERKS